MTRYRPSSRLRRGALLRSRAGSDPVLKLGESDEPGRPRHIRVLPELRSEQVNRHVVFTPAEAFYFGTNFDLVGIEIPPGMHRMTLPAAIARILASQASVLELPEPLWARFLPRTICLAAAWSLSGLVRGKWRRARTYAIENNDPITALLGNRPVGRVFARVVKALFGALIYGMYERIAFGSDAAAASYHSLPLVGRIESQVFLELPDRSTSWVPMPQPRPHTAVFVGELSPRKGVLPLLRAWEAVEKCLPGGQLHVVGNGPLAAHVVDWASLRPTSRRFHGQLPQRDVLQLLPTFAALIAPSMRWGRWREQIGLPIKEALKSGLTIVTTTETGLAPWLNIHGHHVLQAPPSDAELGRAIAEALEHPLPREEVLAALPRVPARVQADQWLHPMAT